MANRKRCEKLAIPTWFRLEAYDGLANLTAPLDWLKQLAFRIDLKHFWQEIADGHVARSSRGKLFFRLAQQAVHTGPAPFETLVKPQPVVPGGVK